MLSSHVELISNLTSAFTHPLTNFGSAFLHPNDDKHDSFDLDTLLLVAHVELALRLDSLLVTLSYPLGPGLLILPQHEGPP